MNIIVCGGRDFTNRRAAFRALDHLHSQTPVTLVIHGAARGADSLARDWAMARNVNVFSVPADWNKHGRAAGYRRNADMLAMSPNGVVAFPGGSGTAHMVRTAEQARVPVWRPYH
jgi:hypothetical protein